MARPAMSLSVSILDFAEKPVLHASVTVFSAQGGAPLPSRSAGGKGFFDIPDGIARIRIEASGKDALGSYYPTVIMLDVRPDGALTTVPGQDPDTLFSLRIGGRPGQLSFDITLYLRPIREVYDFDSPREPIANPPGTLRRFYTSRDFAETGTWQEDARLRQICHLPKPRWLNDPSDDRDFLTEAENEGVAGDK